MNSDLEGAKGNGGMDSAEEGENEKDATEHRNLGTQDEDDESAFSGEERNKVEEETRARLEGKETRKRAKKERRRLEKLERKKLESEQQGEQEKGDEHVAEEVEVDEMETSDSSGNAKDDSILSTTSNKRNLVVLPSRFRATHTPHSRRHDLRAFLHSLSLPNATADFASLNERFLSSQKSPIFRLSKAEFTGTGLIRENKINRDRLEEYLKGELGFSQEAWWALGRLLDRCAGGAGYGESNSHVFSSSSEEPGLLIRDSDFQAQQETLQVVPKSGLGEERSASEALGDKRESE